METALVDANYFTMLGAGAAVGRVFTQDDAQPGIADVAVISHALWARRFGRAPGVLGKRIRIDNDMYSIVGVAAESFRHPGRGTTTEVDVWAPAGWLAPPFPTQPIRRAYLLRGGIGRLPAGVTPEAAQSRVDALVDRLRNQFGADYPRAAGWTLRVIPLRDDLVGHIRPALLVLLAAVGFVLLIACANVASLLLARASARSREIAIRRALGAGRGRLARQLLTESVLLAVVGGLAGLLVAVWGVDLLERLSPADLPRLNLVGLNGSVLAFTAILSLATGVIFGIAPAVQGSNADLNDAIRESSRTATASGRVARLRGALVVSEFALALVLLVAAALLTQSFWRLQNVDLGFRPSSVLTVGLWLPQPNDPPSGPYFKHDARVAFYKRTTERLATLPGVEAVGGVNTLPLSGARGRVSFVVEGRGPDAGDTSVADGALATPGYFRALGIDLVRGRLFDDHDDSTTPLVAVVSEAFGKRFFGGLDPIGKRIAPGARVQTGGGAVQAVAPNWITIIGVVHDVRTSGIEFEPAATIYRPVWQVSNLALTLTVRATGDPAALSELVRREVRAVDPNEPVFAVRTMDAVIASALAQRRFTMLLLAFFAGTALLLSAIGIYGVMAFFVTQRTHEFGIRMALGARPFDVLRLVIAQGVRLAAVGIVLGIAGAIAMARALRAMLYGVDARDPATFAVLSAALTLAALAACYVPARRAIRVDPDGGAETRITLSAQVSMLAKYATKARRFSGLIFFVSSWLRE